MVLPSERNMNLSGLLPLVEEGARLPQPGDVDAPRVLGVGEGAKACVAATLTRQTSAPILLVAPRPPQAQALAEEVAAWLGDPSRVHLFPEREALPYERLAPDMETLRGRLLALVVLRDFDARGPLVVVASGQALSQRTLSPEDLSGAVIRLSVGDRLSPEGLLSSLLCWGYEVVNLVDTCGQASRRGGIVDVLPPTAEQPLRIEFLGDGVESLRSFDPDTQRSLHRLQSAVIGPARELLHPVSNLEPFASDLDFSHCQHETRARFQEEMERLRAGTAFDGDFFYVPFLASGSLLDHLPGEAIVVVDEPADLAAALEEHDAQSHEVRADLEARGELPRGLPLPHQPWGLLQGALAARGRPLNLSRWATGEEEGVLRLPFAPALAYGGRLRALAIDMARGHAQGSTSVIVSQQAQRLAELLAEHDINIPVATELGSTPTSGSLTLVQGSLPQGWTLGRDGVILTLLTDTEVFGFTKQRRAPPRRAGAAREAFLAELAVNDLVVHVEHGIARFAGLVQKRIDGHEQEYLELRYAEGDRLFVPTDQVDRVSRYVGPSDRAPTLTRLGSQQWARAKERVRRAVADLARQLLALYAARQVVEGHAFPPDQPWQQELEASFPYVETTDQLAAVREVKTDMECSRPMDRLVCGDVGYGKTEVAIRAAFKAVLEGMQVAVLVPTTVLAQQHLQTFSERLSSFPLRVEMLSRFRSEREQRLVTTDLEAGAVDIVIGTHRLLQHDVRFKNMGLVIIDEEQRFGVAHKERLKQMRQQVDVLTLSATPIPRTLQMSLSGIRDMSTMETPPEDRLPIKTYVTEFDERLVREAIVHELDRGGQVYFVHNRVHNIEQVARRVRDLVPEAEVAVAHGQMPEELLEQVMLDFVAGRRDVLVCTTIIESGLDIPNVNTILINQADKLGLAQLYQLRGRVGRGTVRAYAYLLFDRHKALSEPAQKRLQTIFEATELGAGFQIALRDLEIRGAGNLLGAEQSGYIGAVGFDLYVRLLADAVEHLKAVQRGEKPPVPATARPALVIDLPVTAHIPPSYVDDVNLRLALYQRMAQVERPDQAEELSHELEDRFGPPPAAARTLLWVVRMRGLARQAGVGSIQTEDTEIVLRMADDGSTSLGESLRDLRSDGLWAGRTQARLDLARLGRSWPERLEQVLARLAARQTLTGAG